MAGCDVSKTICKHLENKLGYPDKGHLSYALRKEWLKQTANDPSWEAKAMRLESALIAYGLPEHEIELLMARYVSNMTLEDITKHFGYINKQAVYYLIQETVKRLKRHEPLKQLLLNLMGGK